jgi:hypothetical protein
MYERALQILINTYEKIFLLKKERRTGAIWWRSASAALCARCVCGRSAERLAAMSSPALGGESECKGCHRFFKCLPVHLARNAACKRSYSTLLSASLTSGPVDVAQGQHEAAGAQRTRMYQENMRGCLAEQLSDLRYQKLVPGSTVDSMKESVKEWLQSAEASLVFELKAHISASSGLDVAELIRSRLEIFKGIETQKTETTVHLRELSTAFIPPVKRTLGRRTELVRDADGRLQSSKVVHDVCWDLPIARVLEALVQHDPAAWQQIQAASDRWSQPPTAFEDPSVQDDWVIADIEDGQAFRCAPTAPRAWLIDADELALPTCVRIDLWHPHWLTQATRDAGA